jgi:hypothetical protein
MLSFSLPHINNRQEQLRTFVSDIRKSEAELQNNLIASNSLSGQTFHPIYKGTNEAQETATISLPAVAVLLPLFWNGNLQLKVEIAGNVTTCLVPYIEIAANLMARRFDIKPLSPHIDLLREVAELPEHQHPSA